MAALIDDTHIMTSQEIAENMRGLIHQQLEEAEIRRAQMQNEVLQQSVSQMQQNAVSWTGHFGSSVLNRGLGRIDIVRDTLNSPPVHSDPWFKGNIVFLKQNHLKAMILDVVGEELVVQLTNSDVITVSKNSIEDPLSSVRTPAENLQISIAKQSENRIVRLERDRSSYGREIVNYEDQIRIYREKVEKVNKLIEISKITVPTDKVFDEIKLLKKHTLVDSIWLSKLGDICVLTKKIKRVDGTQETRDSMGRFLIRIECRNDGGIMVWGLDYIYEGHPHPHLNSGDYGEVCWGNYSEPMSNLLRELSIYGLVDGIIHFMSLCPHPGGSPYTNYGDYMLHREPRDSSVKGNLIKKYCELGEKL